MTTVIDTDLEGVVARELAELGGTPDAVYSSLKAAGTTGWPEDCASCPVANLLHATIRREYPLPVSPRVSVNGCNIDCHVRSLELNTSKEARLNTPGPVVEFIKRFDAGTHYRDLLPNYAEFRRQFPALPPDDTDIEE